MIQQLLRQSPMLVVALLLVAGLGLVLLRKPPAALWLLLGGFALTLATIPPLVALQVTQGGITIYALDLIVALMFAIGVGWLVTRPTPAALSLPLLVLSILLTFHLVWGTAAFGLQAAVNSSRAWLYPLGPLVYCVHAYPNWSRRSFLPLIAVAGVLAGFALVQIARNGLYEANQVINIGGEFVDARPVTALGALTIVQCMLIAIAGRFVRSLTWLMVIVVLGASVLLLQHRTVWIVALVAGSVAYLRWARLAIHVNPRGAAFAAGAILLVSPLVLTSVASSSAFTDSVKTATGEESTFGWRTASWGSLIEAHNSPEEVALGLPAGTSLERRIGDQTAAHSPHSLYVDALLSFGFLGPLAILWLWWLVIRQRHRVAAVLGLSAVTVVLLVASQAMFGVTSMLGPLQGVLLGMLLQAGWITSRNDVDPH